MPNIEKIEALAKAIATIEIASSAVQKSQGWYADSCEGNRNENLIDMLWRINNDLFEASVIMNKELREARKKVRKENE